MRILDERSIIGNYRVIRLLGQGGMGTVYEVEHLELGTHYALKTFTFDSEDDAAHALKTKFLEEGKLLARLKHSNLTHVFDLGFEEGSQMPYFVMDLVTYEDGETYTVEDIELKDIDEDMVYNWFVQLASALDYIHGEGIVHRDIKPSNLLVDKDLNVVLTDFGISRIFGSKIRSEVDATRTMVTKTGRGKLVLGTEHYIAPEVAEGEEATPQADAYSLGVMLLRWLTGFYYGDNPGAVALLSQKKHRWLPVITRLLAPASRRPEKYADLVKQLKSDDDLDDNGRRSNAVGADLRAARKKRKAKENVLATFCALFIVGVLGAGVYFGWCYIERKGAERDRQYAELTQRMEDDKAAAEKKAADEKAEAERRAAEEKRIAEEKLRQEVKCEEKQAQLPSPVVVETPVDKEKPIEEAKPEPKKPEPMVIVADKNITDEKNYGPIPNVKYKWFRGQGNENPLRVDFQMSNGAKIELMPMKKGSFFMPNNWDDKKARHKVTLTRPFWMSKFCVTAEQWREFAPNDCEDCREVEKALGGKHCVYKAFNRKQTDFYCAFLTAKYHSQIPKGYVFRLPTEAEFEYAIDFDATQQKYFDKRGMLAVRDDGELYRSEFLKISKQFNLGVLGKWKAHGVYENDMIRIGGIGLPHASGICDLFVGWQRTLDIVLSATRNIDRWRFDEEIDPLSWVENANIYDNGSVADICVGQNNVRNGGRANERRWFHLVLGPNLIGEKTWENPRKNIECNAPVPNRRYAWEPEKVQKTIKKPKELTFKMSEGGDIIFCTVPAVNNFNMSNPDGQDKLYHKVTLTKPFWITKYCVTTKQWREYAKYDCEGVVRQVEKFFPKNPIYMPFTRAQWDGFCEYLNKRYGHQLPKGYVFRLPTEAEWEWAFVGDKNGDIRKMPQNRFLNTDARFQAEFENLLKKNKVEKSLSFNVRFGTIGEDQSLAYVGGRVDCTDTFGVCDMVAHGRIDSFVFDTYDSNERACVCCQYEEIEKDPVRYAGRLRTKVEYMTWGSGRGLSGNDARRAAHIVVGPDIETLLKKKELEPYSEDDFGGKLLSNVITHGGLSSRFEEQRNTIERFKRMTSNENTLSLVFDEHEDSASMGFHTQSEESPWIQLNLDKRRVITGLQIDALSGWCHERSRHLRVWASEDGKTWREVAAENQCKHRYRFDLQRKNVTAKYIRIGREPGFVKDHFSLDKILIYGKEK